MVPINRRKVSLYEEAKNGLSSLVWQTATVFVGFIFMLLITVGNPSSFAIIIIFILGIAFVAWREQIRVTKLRYADSDYFLDKQRKSTKYNLLKRQKVAIKQVLFEFFDLALYYEDLASYFEDSIAKKSNIESMLSDLQESIAIDITLNGDEKADACEHLKEINQILLKGQSTKQQISQAKTSEGFREGMQKDEEDYRVEFIPVCYEKKTDFLGFFESYDIQKGYFIQIYIKGIPCHSSPFTLLESSQETKIDKEKFLKLTEDLVKSIVGSHPLASLPSAVSNILSPRYEKK